MFICVDQCFWRYARTCPLAYLLEHFSRPTECKARCFALPAARDVSLGKPKKSCWALNERRQNMWITIATMDLLHAACGFQIVQKKWFKRMVPSSTSTESKGCLHQWTSQTSAGQQGEGGPRKSLKLPWDFEDDSEFVPWDFGGYRVATCNL